MLVYFVLGMEGKKMDCYMHFLGKLKGGDSNFFNI